MLEKNRIAKFFEPIVGKPCWGVKQGYGSFLTLEFGNPHIEVTEPMIIPTRLVTKKRKGLITQRVVSIHGDWHLFVQCCNWTIRLHGFEKIHSESSRIQIRHALDILDGQMLTSVTTNSKTGSSIFSFDLGGRLSTYRYKHLDSSGEPFKNWMLYEPDGQILTYRADGKYMHFHEDDKDSEWQQG